MKMSMLHLALYIEWVVISSEEVYILTINKATNDLNVVIVEVYI